MEAVMRKWVVLGIGVFVLHVLGLLLVMPTPRLVLWGFLRGEAFYKGRPVCWWSEELQQWSPSFQPMNSISYQDYLKIAGLLSHDEPDPPFLDVDVDRTTWVRGPRYSGKRANKWLSKFIKSKDPQLPFQSGDPKAVPVLRALLRDENLMVLRIAMTGIRRVGPSASSMLTAVEPLRQHQNVTICREARYTSQFVRLGVAQQSGGPD
jgi:hypothetical protein